MRVSAPIWANISFVVVEAVDGSGTSAPGVVIAFVAAPESFGTHADSHVPATQDGINLYAAFAKAFCAFTVDPFGISACDLHLEGVADADKVGVTWHCGAVAAQ